MSDSRLLELSGAKMSVAAKKDGSQFVITCQEVDGPAHDRRLTGRAIHLGMTQVDAQELLQYLRALEEAGLLPPAEQQIQVIDVRSSKDRN